MDNCGVTFLVGYSQKDELFYMYCDNCRYRNDSIDEYETDHCENCHRKYNGWGISKEVAEAIEERCLKEIK